MAVLILVTLALMPVAAWLGRQGSRVASLLALWPAAAAAYLLTTLPDVTAGRPVPSVVSWVPSLGLDLSFRLDGLSVLFALLITVIGAGIVVYGAHYFDGHRYAGRFQATLFAFMAAMLGVVCSDNVFLLFAFWELTGFTSFLLIGFDHEKADSRYAAIQALIVTGTGGLALLAAGVLLVQVTGTTSLAAMAAQHTVVAAHVLYAPIVGLLLLAAFTKSAQFPFMFWLPNAMAAPTPVSAYLHSATMVKAGIYLVARMTPVVGGSELWTLLVSVAGGTTMVLGAWRALHETDLKAILAYTTLSALGTIMLLLGVGTEATIAAAIVYLVAHACYKGTLFLCAGIVDHETGTRDIRELGGLRRALPVTSAVATLGAASMVGLPLFLGFFAKELEYEAVRVGTTYPGLLTTLVVASSAMLGAAALLVGWLPFDGRRTLEGDVHEASPGLWGPALVLALAGLAFGTLGTPITPLLLAAARGVGGDAVELSLTLWHGFTLTLALSALTVAAALALYLGRHQIRRLPRLAALAGEAIYTTTLTVLDAASNRLAPAFQGGTLAAYILVSMVSTGVLVGSTLYLSHSPIVREGFDDWRVYEVLVAALIIGGALAAVRARHTMAAVLALGTSGYGVALTFILYGAPDLAMTQFAVETLTAVILVFVFWQFPRVDYRSPKRIKLRDGLVAAAFGLIVAALTLQTGTMDTSPRLRDYFAEMAPLAAHGRNIVNVILVDFRALDTLGETTVLVTAAVGVRALLYIAAAERRQR